MFAQKPTRHSNNKHHDNHAAVFHVTENLHFSSCVKTLSVAWTSIVWNGLVVASTTGLRAVGVVGRQ